MELLIVSAASLLAGLVDAIVGGGGLVLVPALFSTFPAAAPATLLGTNKSASVWGTLMASVQYSRRVHMRWAALLPACAAALLGSALGAWTVTQASADFLRRLLPLVLLAVLPRFALRGEQAAAALIGLGIGWYDGFFGPGTGSFFIFLFVRVLGYDFLNASAAAKLLNVATNVAAIALFAAKGHVWWQVGLTMAAANVAGSLIGTRLALRHGAGFVRGVFIVVVGALILKTGRDAFWG